MEKQVEYDKNMHLYSGWGESTGGVNFLVFTTCANVGCVFANCQGFLIDE